MEIVMVVVGMGIVHGDSDSDGGSGNSTWR
jgi:hypothetical protein